MATRFAWHSFWNCSAKSYVPVLWNDLLIRYYIFLTLSFLGYSANFVMTKKTAYFLSTYCSILNAIVFDRSFSNLSQYKISTSNLQIQDQFRCLGPNYTLCSYDITRNVTFQNFLLGSSIIDFMNHYWVTSSSISYYIAKQLSSLTTRDVTFKRGLSKGITSLVVSLLKTPEACNIKGIFIVCKGRWSKTRSGRSQVTSLKIGSQKQLKLSSNVISTRSVAVTKYGACSIKVFLHLAI